MITKKQLKTQIDELTNEIKELSKIVVTDELKNLREIKKLYEEQTNLLSNVKFRVKSGKIPSVKSKCQNEVIYGSYTGMKNLTSKKTVTFADEIECDLSYTNGKLTSYGVDWGGDSIANVNN